MMKMMKFDDASAAKSVMAVICLLVMGMEWMVMGDF